MSCSSNRKIAVGSCISTFVSSTNSRRPSRGLAFMSRVSLEVAAPGPGSERLRRFKHFLRVARDFHLAPLVSQYALAVQQKGAALNSQKLPAVQALLLDDVEELTNLLVRVTQQRKG